MCEENNRDNSTPSTPPADTNKKLPNVMKTGKLPKFIVPKSKKLYENFSLDVDIPDNGDEDKD